MEKDGMVSYRLEVPEQTWEAWKDTVPRSVPNLTDAIIIMMQDAIAETKK